MRLFITLEGPEGSGKSTQMALLATYLRNLGYDVVASREPGGTSIGDQIREVLHDTRNTEMASSAEVLLYSASRAQLVEQVIRPALDAGKIVLLDRYADSTVAYQGYGRGLDLSMLDRRRSRGEEMNRLDLETNTFHNRVREGYHQLAALDTDRWVIVDAGRPMDEIQNDLQQIVIARIKSETENTTQKEGV